MVGVFFKVNFSTVQSRGRLQSRLVSDDHLLVDKISCLHIVEGLLGESCII